MTTKNKFRLFAFGLGGLLLAASSYNLYRQWDQPLDGAWTPRYLAQEVHGVSDEVQILVSGEPLSKILAEGRLSVTGKDGPLAVPASAVTVRTNKYAEQRVDRVPQALASAAVFGAALMLLALGLIVPLLGGVITNRGGLTELHLLHEA